jgi:hypothetical protein
VLNLLIAQCADLEALLELARREEAAAEARNFDEMLRVVEGRATLGERLEVYHRQIAELRQRMGEAAEPALRTPVARQVTALASEILAQDARTRPLLVAARNELAQERLRLDRGRSGVSAYLQDGNKISIACDQRA